jgi:hypothetical protein
MPFIRCVLSYAGRGCGAVVTLAALLVVLSGCSSSPGTAGPAAAPTAPAAPDDHAHVAGPITSEEGTTWVVQTDTGKAYTVIITAATGFGGRKHPAARNQFAVGNIVRVTGALSGTTIIARRVSSPSDPLG